MADDKGGRPTVMTTGPGGVLWEAERRKLAGDKLKDIAPALGTTLSSLKSQLSRWRKTNDYQDFGVDLFDHPIEVDQPLSQQKLVDQPIVEEEVDQPLTLTRNLELADLVGRFDQMEDRLNSRAGMLKSMGDELATLTKLVEALQGRLPSPKLKGSRNASPQQDRIMKVLQEATDLLTVTDVAEQIGLPAQERHRATNALTGMVNRGVIEVTKKTEWTAYQNSRRRLTRNYYGVKKAGTSRI